MAPADSIPIKTPATAPPVISSEVSVGLEVLFVVGMCETVGVLVGGVNVGVPVGVSVGVSVGVNVGVDVGVDVGVVVGS